MNANINIREITSQDNTEVCTLITTVMTEFECVGEGFSINDAEVKCMSEAYADAQSYFLVVELDGKIAGCGGIGPLKGSTDICELRKMYFYPNLRGLGIGQKVLDLCLEKAKSLGYKQCYLETVARMTKAKKLYAKNGFKPLNQNVGNTGHSSCDSYYIKDL
ncbi:MAG: GNAT family N-acetyltransferase [Saprospiraceae bacterium]|nr:GNAT family N-acetyltransferase [Bacteroidia bacterium]NNE14388.1 GNAT family N-acetyltransferase [Saprospiraceae bacterium]NNL92076.1 GNAT family N-acetyltransferase [Saprospiraceae bacterium]